jgi:hypothetical protein
MLMNRLRNIYRIATQNPPKKEESAPIQISTKPIAVKRMHFSEVDKELEQTKLLTNKLLSRNWSELDQKEKAYFKDDNLIFEFKKAKLIENSQIESELKSLHAQMGLAKSDNTRQPIAQRMVELKKIQAKNWGDIDNFETFADLITDRNKSEDTAHIDKGELIQRRNNLRARISKTIKKSKNSDDPALKTKLEELKTELVEVESKL